MPHVKRRNNKWQISVEKGVNPLTGERERVYQTIPDSENMTKTQAEREMAKLVAELEYGTYIEPENMKIGEFLIMWLEDECQHNLAPRSYQRYERIVKKHLLPALGKIPLQKLKPMHVKTYQSQKLKNGKLNGSGGLSNKTVRMHVHLLSQALKYACGLQILNNNPCEHVKAPTARKPKVNYLEEEELSKLLKYIKQKDKDWNYLFYSLAVHTGMRRGELLALKWENVDFDNAKLYVRETLQRIPNKGLELKEYPKTEASCRNIDISQRFVTMLKKYKKGQDDHKNTDINYTDNNMVFCNKDGSLINPNKPTRRLSEMIVEADVKKIRLHDLRHTHASLLLKEGIQPKVVQERLGHSSIAITMDRYSHLFPSIQKEAATKMDNLFDFDDD